MKHKPFVYVAGPYTRGDSCINTHCQMQAFDQILSDGIVTPYVPLWSHFQHTAFPRHYQDWIDYDIELLESGGFDAIIRLDAVNADLDYRVSESSGADGEVEWFVGRGLPVFYNLTDLYAAWHNNQIPLFQRSYPRTPIE